MIKRTARLYACTLAAILLETGPTAADWSTSAFATDSDLPVSTSKAYT